MKRPSAGVQNVVLDLEELTDVPPYSSVLQSTPPRQDAEAASVLKPSNEIADNGQVIMDRRRLVEPNDRCPITVQATLTRMYNTWMHEWLEENLTRAQQKLAERKQTSIFCISLPQFWWQAARHGPVEDGYTENVFRARLS